MPIISNYKLNCARGQGTLRNFFFRVRRVLRRADDEHGMARPKKTVSKALGGVLWAQRSSPRSRSRRLDRAEFIAVADLLGLSMSTVTKSREERTSHSKGVRSSA